MIQKAFSGISGTRNIENSSELQKSHSWGLWKGAQKKIRKIRYFREFPEFCPKFVAMTVTISNSFFPSVSVISWSPVWPLIFPAHIANQAILECIPIKDTIPGSWCAGRGFLAFSDFFPFFGHVPDQFDIADHDYEQKSDKKVETSLEKCPETKMENTVQISRFRTRAAGSPAARDAFSIFGFHNFYVFSKAWGCFSSFSKQFFSFRSVNNLSATSFSRWCSDWGECEIAVAVVLQIFQ